MVRQGERLLTVEEAAQMAGLAAVTVRLHLKEGRIEGRKIGRDWVITPAAVRAYLKNRRPPGRPPKDAE